MRKKNSFSRYETVYGEEILFPVCFVEGAFPGPRVCVTAGVHGCEYPAIVAAMHLSRQLKPETMKGIVSIIPLVNLNAFQDRSMFVSPEDQKNLNRVMPGDAGGTFSEALAWHLFEDFIRGSDAYIDLHGGDIVEDLIPFSIVHRGDNKAVFAKSIEMAESFGLEDIIVTSRSCNWSDIGTFYAHASEEGIPSMIAEVGRIGQLCEGDVKMHLDGLFNVLRHVGILEGSVSDRGKYMYYDQFVWVQARIGGVFITPCNAGQYVGEGQYLGVIENYFGEHVETVISPVSGRIMFLTTSPAVKGDGLLFGIAVETVKMV